MEKTAPAKRILFLTPDYPMWDGGVSVLADKFALFFCRHGHTVTVATPLQLAEDKAFDHRQPHRVLRWKNVKDRYLKFFYAQWKLRRLLGRETFDHVICLTWHPFANAAFRYSQGTNLTVMANGNDFLENRWQRPFWKRRMHQAFHQADHVVCCSNESKRVLLKTIPGLETKTHALLPAVDPNEFAPDTTPRQPPVLLTLGRVVARKGQDTVIRALPKILKEFPDVQYWVAGRGAHLASLKALVTQLGLEDNVQFLGFVSAEQRLRLYQECTIYLMPSRTIGDQGDFEGFGITYLEANACGRPTIGGRSGGVADAVLDGETGFLVNPESPDEIAEKTLRLLRDPELAARLGRQGRERIERELNWDATARKLAGLIGAA
jgi:phosphatidylinositol alpha-1,6-mannosyltransferase